MWATRSATSLSESIFLNDGILFLPPAMIVARASSVCD